jgi:hypothetical protein
MPAVTAERYPQPARDKYYMGAELRRDDANRFVGRARLLKEVAQLLPENVAYCTKIHRNLIALSGIGGVG